MDGEYSRHDQLETILQDSNSEPQDLSLAYLKKITNEFANELLLGEGGFGKVYKGVLQNGRIVAVKKLFQLKPELQAKQFENEVYHLMRLKHPNIVRFVGYCYETRNECVEFNGQLLFAEKQQRLLCLEYLSNGSLDRHLSDESSGLDWGTRYKIIKGICCGIHYLHEGCKYQINGSIIHLDLKPANILLDDNMVPKVADFGLSRLFHGTKTETCTTNLAGTFAYMAPEYIYKHVITTKADIYSLGVLIIEIITGDRPDPFSFNSTSSEDFVEAVLQNWRNRLKDAPLETDCNQIKLCLEIGLKCFKVDRNERPTAKEIIDSLDAWERRNSVDKHKLEENTNSVDNNGDALQLMLAAAALAGLAPAPTSGAPAPALALGINYGRVADNLPPPQAALLLLRALNATRVKLYDADARVLRAFAGSGVDFTVGVPDRLVLRLAADPSAAAAWVHANLLPHLPATSITAVTVGNEVLSGTDAAMLRSLLPAMESLHAALAVCNLSSRVSVTTAHSLAVLSSSFPPSSAAFRREVLPYMSPLLGFLSMARSPFLINCYPYFAYKADPGNVPLEYVLFQPNAGVTDAITRLNYDNMLYAQVDSVYAAIQALGHTDIDVKISETGWPSRGDPDEAGATPEYAGTYIGNLLQRIEMKQGTPLRPSVPIDVYVFALFNENLKPGPASERNYGLFYPDGTPVYNIGLRGYLPPMDFSRGTRKAVHLFAFILIAIASITLSIS